MSVNRTQLFSIGALVVFLGGTATAIHFDREGRARALAGTSTVVREPDELAPSNGKEAAVPMSLTASDGTGLRLTALSAKAVVEEPLAFTELRLVFENPLDRAIEGTFSITLPTGASVGRFAMRLGELWQEGEVVEKQAARRAYEDFLHRRQDPALLEQAAGNEFTARVFPIPARGKKELIISYSQELAGRGYTLPLRGLPAIGSIDIKATNADGAVIGELVEQNHSPNADFVTKRAAATAPRSLRADNLIVARVYPIPDSQPEPLVNPIVLFDTSASRALGFEDQLALLQTIADSLKETSKKTGAPPRMTVVCFDQTVGEIFDIDARSFDPKVLDGIRRRGALGASNLEAALGWVHANATKKGSKRIVLIGDGVSTAGETDADKLGATVASLERVGIERLDAIAVGGIRDEAGLRRITTAGLHHDGAVIEGRLVTSALTRRLNESTRSNISIAVPNARWSYPAKVDGIQAGDEVLVYADLTTPNIDVLVDGVSMPIEARTAPRALVERSWVKAKMESLAIDERRALALVAKSTDEDKDKDKKDSNARTTAEKLHKDIVDLSIKHRVTSSYTSFLVLETEQDYERFKIDRTNLSDILTVDGGKLALRHRNTPDFKRIAEERDGALRFKPPMPEPTANPSAGVGGGLSIDGGVATTSGGEGTPAPSNNRAPTAEQQRINTGAGGGPGTADSDPLGARGNMWGDAIGDAFGAGGLGLSGVGEGGGGTGAAGGAGEGIGLGTIGTLGHGAGTGTGQGFGSGHGRLGGSHQTSAPTLRQGATEVNGRLPPEVIQRIVRQSFGRFRLCYENGLRNNPNLSGRVAVRFIIGRNGAVESAQDGGSDIPDAAVVGCVVRSFRNMSFPQPEGGIVMVRYPILFNPGGGAPSPRLSGVGTISTPPQTWPPDEPAKPVDPYVGNFKNVMDKLRANDLPGALAIATAWRKESLGDVMALTALGEVYEKLGDLNGAARAYGSVIDLFSSRADLRRFAGIRLEHLAGSEAAADLAIDTFAKAALQRPDHPQSHRLYAYALLRYKKQYAKAFEAMEIGLKQKYPDGRFRGVDRIMKEDLGLIGAAWIAAEPQHKEEVVAKIKAAEGHFEEEPSLRFILNWETDANDVDFHIYDGKGNHAYYSQKELPTGGELYADVTTGYGPECFTIRRPREGRSGPYKLQANYYAIGPMGYGMGKLEVIEHDGKGNLIFDERPYVVMVDHAFVDMGVVK